MEAPETRYARSGDLSIAYQLVGSGDVDLVFVPGFVSHVELLWEGSPLRPLVEGLARFARVLVFDKRGTGLSDRSLGAGTLEERMDDVRSVMDAAGLERAAIMGLSEGGPMALLFAATYPERVSSLVLFASYARPVSGPDYPHGPDPSLVAPFIDVLEQRWGDGSTLMSTSSGAPAGDGALKAAARFERNATTPHVAASIMRRNSEIDVRDILDSITVPTLVAHCARDPFIDVAHGRYLASHVPGATYLELDADFHITFRDEQYDELLDAIEERLTGTTLDRESERVLKTVLYTDIVGSTETIAMVGDRRWRELLDAHDRIVRHALVRARGEEINTTGDGFLAAFDGPARAVRCAQAIVAATADVGIEVRAGLHTGECERRGQDLAGMAVHIGARVAALASGGEVLVSSTVRDLVAGSGLQFEERGEQALKGVPGQWRILAVRGDDTVGRVAESLP